MTPITNNLRNKVINKQNRLIIKQDIITLIHNGAK